MKKKMHEKKTKSCTKHGSVEVGHMVLLVIIIMKAYPVYIPYNTFFLPKKKREKEQKNAIHTGVSR